MRDTTQYETKLVAELNWQVKTKLDHIAEDLGHEKLSNRQNFKDIRKLRRRISHLYVSISFLFFFIVLLGLNTYNSV